MGDIIYDIGFHTGEDTAYYLARGWNVIAVEANPMLVRRGYRRFRRELGTGQLKLLNVGIADRGGRMTFFVNPTMSQFSSFDRNIASRGDRQVEEVDVEVRRLDELIREFGEAHYVKIDIEGYDHQAITTLLDAEGPKPDYLSMENGQEQSLNLLRNLGYTAFAWINQADVTKARIPKGSVEGRVIRWTFEFGASGLFGSDLGWSSFESVLVKSKEYWGNPARDPTRDGWYDVHAALRVPPKPLRARPWWRTWR